MDNILITITDQSRSGLTYTLDVRNDDAAILCLGNVKIKEVVFANDLGTPELLDAAKLFAHHMDIHTICDHSA